MPSSQSTPIAYTAARTCTRCLRQKLQCKLPVGSRACVNCTKSKFRCRLSREEKPAVTRFRARLVQLRSLLAEVITSLDSVDFVVADSDG
jgi:hypothetical protein